MRKASSFKMRCALSSGVSITAANQSRNIYTDNNNNHSHLREKDSNFLNLFCVLKAIASSAPAIAHSYTIGSVRCADENSMSSIILLLIEKRFLDFTAMSKGSFSDIP